MTDITIVVRNIAKYFVQYLRILYALFQFRDYSDSTENLFQEKIWNHGIWKNNNSIGLLFKYRYILIQ